MYNLANIQTGDILGVEGTSFLARAIQKFQALSNKESAHINHTGIFWWINGRLFVIEAAEKGVTFTNFNKYLKSKSKLYHFKHIPTLTDGDKIMMEDLFIKYQDNKYNYMNLFKYQIVYKLTGWWTGTKSKRKMVCHSFTQRVWDELKDIFPDWAKADVSRVYFSMYFGNNRIK